ncbi:MAG: hypothetical protein COA79_22185 [Planctomycetota bacterium]|nr:MAG: hypothetical protein COA79_22185 [Planctomycetota bacterium]
MIKKSNILYTSLLLVAIILTCSFKKNLVPKKVAFTCIVFDHKQNEVKFSGNIKHSNFKKWFISDYPVAGERIETPKNSISFGVLILNNNGNILIMPLYKWKDQNLNYFSCQSQQIGMAPMLSIIDNTKKGFFKKLKIELDKLK